MKVLRVCLIYQCLKWGKAPKENQGIVTKGAGENATQQKATKKMLPLKYAIHVILPCSPQKSEESLF